MANGRGCGSPSKKCHSPKGQQTCWRQSVVRWEDWIRRRLANLPRGWNILYCLTRLDRHTVERLIRGGIVHPKLTLREAKELVAQFTGKKSPDQKRKAN